jgi:plastocyanin
MLRRKTIAGIAKLAVVTFITAQTVACFSEHTDTTGLHEDCEIPAGAEGPGRAVVTIAGFDFAPDTLRVSANTTITWVNCDKAAGAEAHTSTSDTGVWSSPLFAEGDTFVRSFASIGSFPYHCVPHPDMKAVIIVQ